MSLFSLHFVRYEGQSPSPHCLQQKGPASHASRDTRYLPSVVLALQCTHADGCQIIIVPVQGGARGRRLHASAGENG